MDKTPNILVIGDLMVDHYLWGDCDRISPEAPVQVVDIKKENKRLGGAGNVIANLKALGANVEVFSVVGDDFIGDEILKMLENMQVKAKLIKEKNRKSAQKCRLMAVHQQVIRFDKESKEDICEDSQNLILDNLQKCCLLYTSPSPRDKRQSRMPSSA